MEAVHRYEGTVNQVMGDGIMALFGAPLAHEDHAVRACYAALDMQDAMRRYAEEVRRAHGVEVQIRVGLNSGEVVVRAIGSDLRMDYTAVGPDDPPGGADGAARHARHHPAHRRHAAARRGLRRGQAARPGAGEGAGGARRGLRAGRARAPRGRACRRRPRAGSPASSGATPSWSSSARRSARAAAGHGQVVAVVGEPGVGQVAPRLGVHPLPPRRTAGSSLEAGSVSYGKATPYLPVIDLLKGYFADRGPRRARATVREKVTGKLLTLDRALGADAAGAPGAARRAGRGRRSGRRSTRPSAASARSTRVKRLLLRESQVQPLLLVFEDLHWIDAETQALLDSLVESLPTARLLLLVNYRPEYQHALGQQDLLHAAPPRSAAARERRRAARRPARRRRRPRAAQARS